MNDIGHDLKSGGRRRGLGRGLSALIPESSVEISNSRASGHSMGQDGVLRVPIEFLKPSPYQPRRHFAADELDGLAESIRAKGIMQPLLVRPDRSRSEYFEIVAGERRWRAAQRAGLHDLPVVIHDLSDRDTLEVALLENVQRQDLSPLEEAEGYQRLLDEFGHTQQELAETIGKSRSHIANLLRLLGLPRAVRDLLESAALSAGHARALLVAEQPAALARLVVDRGLNVRQTEALVRAERSDPESKSGSAATPKKDADTLALERELAGSLGLSVALNPKGQGGVISIAYRSLDQLDGLLKRLR